MDDVSRIIKELENLQDPKRQEINIFLGASENQFGVSINDLRTLSREIDNDQDLAFRLWETKNEDAMVLSTMIMNPLDISLDELDELVKDITYHTLADEFTFNVLLDTGYHNDVYSLWLLSDNPAVSRVAWNIVITKIMQGDYFDLDFKTLLNVISNQIKTAPMVLQEVQNRALIEMGIRFDECTDRALDIARKVGKLTGRNARWQVIPYAYDEIRKGRVRITY